MLVWERENDREGGISNIKRQVAMCSPCYGQSTEKGTKAPQRGCSVMGNKNTRNNCLWASLNMGINGRLSKHLPGTTDGSSNLSSVQLFSKNISLSLHLTHVEMQGAGFSLLHPDQSSAHPKHPWAGHLIQTPNQGAQNLQRLFFLDFAKKPCRKI